MRAKKRKMVYFEQLKLFKKEGSFLLEAMIGTAIFSVVMVFFASVSVSAYLLMQRAYYETEITEAVFQKVESHRYSEVQTDESASPITGGAEFVMGKLDDFDLMPLGDKYVRYITPDGTVGELDSLEMELFSGSLFSEEIYAFRYQETQDSYSAVFYILKGEK